MNKILTVCAALVVSSQLAACATSPYAGYSNAPLAQTALVGAEDCDIVSGVCKAGSNVNPQRLVPKLAVESATRYSVTCSKDVDEQVSNMLQSAAYGAGTYAIAEGLGTGGGVRFVSKAATGYYSYGAVVGAATGAVSGAQVGAQSAAIAKGECVKSKMDRVQGEFPAAITLTITGGKAFGATSRIRTASSPTPETR